MDNKFMKFDYDMRNKFKHADVKKFVITKENKIYVNNLRPKYKKHIQLEALEIK